ncbi:MAG: hypothetical protein ACXWNI_00610 [Candidatus Limnocylindrales bacterium]
MNVGRRLTGLGGSGDDSAAAEATTTNEPCAACGDDTSVGSSLFGERHEAARPEGGKIFLCDECYARLRAVRGGRLKPTEEDLNVIAANGGVMGVGFLPGLAH